MISQQITNEVAAIRSKAAQVVQDAHDEAARMEAQAVALEQKLPGIPAELEALTEDAAARAWAWIKGAL